ncbi:MAG TPA: glutamate 5-kinase [Candidatus Acidoferrales bacterium]|jgi:glutamate 5-kinase|nr:glutamate 5-kinase [Candidatus Acidoferrales bacterium]
MESERQKRLKSARRIVIKVGTSTVTGAQGEICSERVQPIADSIAKLINDGRQVVLVSSGAVGLGRGWLGLHPSRLHDMVTMQACAAVGQSLLMDAYRDLFSASDVKIAQVLLTEDDFTNWHRYSNLRRTMEKLLGFGVLPIVNENDTVSTAELEQVTRESRTPVFSDNDRLAALVMSGLEADALVLLTNVDGLLRPAGNENGHRGKASEQFEVISLVDEITPELKSLASGPSASGRGGMRAKLEAAEIAMNCGGLTVIANGQGRDTIGRIFDGDEIGTAFLPTKRMRGKRRWIAYAADVRGRVVVDAGAHRAITQGKASLLASGIMRVESHFAPMDVVSIVDAEGREFARGIANCASAEAEQASSRKRREAGRSSAPSPVLVTRDNIVLMEKV